MFTNYALYVLPRTIWQATDAGGESVAAAAEESKELMDYVVQYGMPILFAFATFILGMWLAKLLRGMMRRVLNARSVDPTLVGFLCSIAYMGMMTMVCIAAIGKLGVETTSFVAILGAAGLAVGFALQSSLGNFAAGVMIILFRPFKAGDFVELAGTSGVVLDVKVFATTLKTGDNRMVIVPNGSIMGSNITNYSANPTRRVDMVFGCGYDDDLKQAKALLEKILADDDRVLADPEPVVAVSELADSSVNFVVRPWCNAGDYWAVRWDTHERVKLEFDKAGIGIPYPQQDVHMHQVAS